MRLATSLLPLLVASAAAAAPAEDPSAEGPAMMPPPATVDADTSAAWRAAEELEATARASGRLADAEACAAAYLAIHDTAPTGVGADEALYDSAACLEGAGDARGAIARYLGLRAEAPTSPLARPALLHAATNAARIGAYAEAAPLLAEYAFAYPTDPAGIDAASDALYYYRALGDAAALTATTQRFIATFGAAQPARAAAAHYACHRTSIADVRRRWCATCTYLSTYADADPGVALANPRPHPGLARCGRRAARSRSSTACAPARRRRARRRDHRRAPPSRCAAPADAVPTPPLLGGAPRAAGRQAVRAARREAAWDQARGSFGADTGVLTSPPRARLALADAELEGVLAGALPRGLDFDPRTPKVAARSLERFEAWLRQQVSATSAVRSAYDAVIEVRDARTILAATARLGQLARWLARSLRDAEIPTPQRGYAAAAAAYCEALASQATPLELRAAEAFTSCATRSRDLGYWDEWSTLCADAAGPPLATPHERLPAAVPGVVPTAPEPAELVGPWPVR
ncbi:MAG: hypothetical protein R2939_08780 [Kofleriaceae bacterium]